MPSRVFQPTRYALVHALCLTNYHTFCYDVPLNAFDIIILFIFSLSYRQIPSNNNSTIMSTVLLLNNVPLFNNYVLKSGRNHEWNDMGEMPGGSLLEEGLILKKYGK